MSSSSGMKNGGAYLICATYRSGSTLLCQGLSDTGVGGEPAEFFHRLNETPLSRSDYVAFVREIKKTSATSNGVFGAKLLWHHLNYLVERVRVHPEFSVPSMSAFEILSRLFRAPRFIYLTRRDKLRQAISLFKARQTGRFHVFDGVQGRRDRTEPVFDYVAIDRLRARCAMQDAAWRTFFQVFGIEPLSIVYEDFARDYEGTLKRALAFLRISLPAAMELKPPSLKKTSDHIDGDWADKYREIREKRKERADIEP